MTKSSSDEKRAPGELAQAAAGRVVAREGGRRTPRRAVQLVLFPQEKARPATVKRLLRVPH